MICFFVVGLKDILIDGFRFVFYLYLIITDNRIHNICNVIYVIVIASL